MSYKKLKLGLFVGVLFFLGFVFSFFYFKSIPQYSFLFKPRFWQHPNQCQSCHQVHPSVLPLGQTHAKLSCVQCHMPGGAGKTKQRDGLRIGDWSSHFQSFKNSQNEIISRNCLICHGKKFENNSFHNQAKDKMSCLACHGYQTHANDFSKEIATAIKTKVAPAHDFDAEACLQCHTAFQPQRVAEIFKGPHAKTSTSCDACHSNNHAWISEHRGVAKPENCARCHQGVVQEFLSGPHGQADQALNTALQYHFSSGELSPKQCYACHRIGAKEPWNDLAVQCASCHAAHGFKKTEAAKPETCQPCHNGPDTKLYQLWKESRHGRLWTVSEGKKGASCNDCHKSGAHDPSRGVVYRASQEGVSESLLSQSRDQYMMGACLQCHDAKTTRDFFRKANAIEEEMEDLMDKARFLIEDLDQKGILTPLLVRVARNPLTGKKLELGPQMHADPHYPRILNLYYKMLRKDLVRARKALFHADWQQVPELGGEDLKQDYVEVLSEYNRLITQAQASQQTVSENKTIE